MLGGHFLNVLIIEMGRPTLNVGRPFVGWALNCLRVSICAFISLLLIVDAM